MSMPIPTRRIPSSPRLLASRDFSRDLISLEPSLEIALGMPLNQQRQTPRASSAAASTRHSLPLGRASALSQQNEADCLRALANVSASFDCDSPALWPTTHCGRSWVPRWRELQPRGGQRRKLSCERSSNAFPRMPAARTASVALGSAPSPVARWDSLLLLSRTVQSALGRFLLLAPSGDGSSLSPALWGPAQTSLKYAKVLAAFAPVASATYALPHGAGCGARPKTRRVLLQTVDLPNRLWSQTFFNQHSNLIKEQISHHASY
jgi:hypothetical protein